MELVTHGLLGATLADATAAAHSRLPPRERVLLGAVAAMLPDIDFIGFLINLLVFLADWHQGPTHSLILLPLWALLIGGAYAALRRQRGVIIGAVLVSALGLASHIAADLITAYGVALLYPLSERRYSLATTFVIDPLVTAIPLAGLAVGLRTRRRLPAGVALTVLALYVGAQATLQRQAVELGREAAQVQGLGFERLAALPQPFSPFRRFAVYPSVSRVDADGDETCVWFTDLRYDLPSLPDTFRYGFCREAYEQPWRLYRLRYFSERSRQPMPT